MFARCRIVSNLCRSRLPKCCHETVGRKRLEEALTSAIPTVSHSHDLASKRLQNIQESPRNKFTNRTNTCGELTIDNVGEKVQLGGWIEFQRMGKFMTLRDSYGSTQLIVPEDREDLTRMIRDLAFETVISVIGTVYPRPEGQTNQKMKTGEIEVHVECINILNPAQKHLPFSIRHFNKAKEALRMQYRYLDLRFSEMQTNLRLRSKVLMKMREYLVNQVDFVDVETPTLFKRTPGGAREFIVPTRHPGQFYSLVQSPQQFKQLLMIGGIDRYFQIARCYRDEGSRHDRQPEFTQLDIEMSFTDREGIMGLIEGLLMYSWPTELGPIEAPFGRMTYNDAMEFYGSDQPDLRIPYKLQNLTQAVTITGSGTDEYEVYAVVFPNGNEYFTNAIKSQFAELAKKQFGAAKLVQVKVSGDSWKSGLNKLFSEESANNMERNLDLHEGDTMFLALGRKTDAQGILGKVRVEFTNILESKGLKIRSPGYNLQWIIDFPLFSRGENGSIESTHHPFTLPHSEDMQFLISDPLKVRSLHYDLVMNGSEIGGGSIRIHDSSLQRKVLDMLKINTSDMSHLLEALSSGAPPHGGIALGLDRLIALLCNATSIRSVIAFPKTTEGRDLMSGAPVELSDEEKGLYHIRTLDDSNR